MPDSPLDAHAASPREISDRIAAERRGAPFLVYRDGDQAQVILDLGRAAEKITIGRRDTCEVPLTWDHEVSRVHAELERLGDDWVLVDDGLSHNGTFVNGERVVARRRLRDGDTITLGATVLVFAAPSGGSMTAPTVTGQRPLITADLSPAQKRVLLALCRPFKDSVHAAPATNQQIAAELVVSVDAVKSTLRQLFEVFGVSDLPQNAKRASLAMRALQSGLVSRRDL
jgi:pSer/pThr/pTyr-binding forkhead associated (FHA) protein